jgi:hypothetical protein
MSFQKRALKIALPALVAVCALPVFAENVTFSTTGTFNCGTAVGCSTSLGGSKITLKNNGNTATDQAIGQTYTNLLAGNDPNSDVDVMTFIDKSTAVGTKGASVNGSSFILTITQLAPVVSPDHGTLTGGFSGQIYYKNTSAFINFGANTSLVLGNITYKLDSPIWNMANPGHTTGIAIQTAQVTPEPTFMLLTGLAFVGFGLLAYQRRREA